MCTIDKMLIKGIRSFSPDNTAVITFFKPLTLIVGPNGAGKTTVIECLKHACTGELPPNARSGHSFIHDPKVAGETETKGQIKLRFKTAAGKDVVCIRSFQLTQKASKLEYKAIESVLQTINANTGEKVCLSYRCADMDREVPALMGVSKAILENVIFVHQDEANWPLADGATLKKKFDDIFSATKYTKALEVIKKLHKEQAQLIKEYKLKLDHLQTIRDSACKLQESIENDQEKSKALQAKIQMLDEKISTARNKYLGVEQKLHSMRQLQEELRVKEGRRELLARQRIQQYNDLEVENEDTDEELAEWHANFESSLGSLKIKIAKSERELNDLKMQISAEKENFNKLCTVKGRLQAEAEAHARDKGERDSLLAAMYAKHGLGDIRSSVPLTPQLAMRVSKELNTRLEELQANLANLQRVNREEVEKLRAAKGSAQEKLAEASGNIRVLAQQKKETERLIVGLQETLGALNVSESDVRRVEEREKSTKESLDGISQKLRDGQFEPAIDEVKAEIFSLSQRMKALQREKDGLVAESGDRMSLRMKQEALTDKQAALEQILLDHEDKLKSCLSGLLPPVKDMAREIEKVVSHNRTLFEDMEEQSKAAGQQAAALRMRAQDAEKDLADARKQRESKQRVLLDRMLAVLYSTDAAAAAASLPSAADSSVVVDQLEEKLSVVTKEAEEKKRSHDLLDGMRLCFNRFMEMTRESHACPLCDRKFDSPQEEDAFMGKQREHQIASSDALRETASAHLALEAQAKSLAALRPLYLEYSRLSSHSIPAGEAALAAAQAELRQAEEKHSRILSALAAMAAQHAVARSLQPVGADVQRLWSECEALKADVAQAEYKLDALSSQGGARSMAAVSEELAAVEDKKEGCERRREKLSEAWQALKDEFASWNMRWRNAREEKMVVADRLGKRREAGDRLAAARDKLRATGVEEQSWAARVPGLQREVERLAAEQEEQRLAGEGQEGQLAERVRGMQREADQVKAVSAKVDTYVASGHEGELAGVLASLASSQALQARCESQAAEVAGSLAGDQQVLDSQGAVKRSIDANLAYRAVAREERACVAGMEALQAQLGGGDGRLLLEELEREGKAISGQVQAWQAEVHRSHGAVQAHEGNIAGNKRSLSAPQYKDIDSKYRRQLVQLKTTEMANRDLDKYHTALDRALMQFHAMKMEEINKIIKELWQQTYRGQDIDYVEIRSDAEATGTRSYSYRVVMHSGDAELEMRGRCSAGQKVLASLVIRLALAETFCLNCGILALDEPTTNLDYPNADSLAAALLRIMEDRRGQENFQLIVITHDERFAQMIGQKQHAESYYRIAKDDHQHSKIEIQDIFE